jgi:YfiH family protein
MTAQNGFSYRRGKNGVLYLACEAIADKSGCSHCFSTRIGGVSGAHLRSMNLGLERGDAVENLEENYSRIAAAAGISQDGFCFTRQVHGDCIRVVTKSDKKQVRLGRDVPECDALLTDSENTPLVCVSADCVPILLYAADKRACGAVHAGWRGTALGIAKKAVLKMVKEFGVKPENIIAAIGPSISPCCFLTHDDVPREMEEGLGSLALGFIKPCPDGRFSVDLKGINFAQLACAGVKRIYVSPDCTCCNPDKYYSHRRDGALRGSMASIIELKGSEN